MGSNNVEVEDDYSCLKDLRLEINGEEATFSLCFWLYLSNSTPFFPSTILRQMCSETRCSVPFLVLDEKKRMMLLPLLFLHKEAPSPDNPTPWTEIPHASAKIVFPFEKWVHVGCEVATDLVRLHIDGEIVGEKPLTSSSSSDSDSHGLRRVSLAGADGDNDRFQGYVHGLEFLHKSSSIKDHFVKDPPLQLSIDGSSASEIEEDNDGVWSIVGGKASCRRNFSLDVIFLDVFGKRERELMNKEMEVVASLIYADNGTPVEKPNDAEAPLLTSYDGIEFAACDRPSKLINGRASFKLKISQSKGAIEPRLLASEVASQICYWLSLSLSHRRASHASFLSITAHRRSVFRLLLDHRSSLFLQVVRLSLSLASQPSSVSLSRIAAFSVHRSFRLLIHIRLSPSFCIAAFRVV